MNATEIEPLLRSSFGVDPVRCVDLAGEVDDNTLVVDADERRYVLKIHAPATPVAELDMQDAALRHVAAAGLGHHAPQVIGRETVEVGDDTRVARLLSWIEGRPLDPESATPELLRTIGRTVGHVDRVLAGFEHPATDRPYRWNMLQCGGLDPAANDWAATTIRSFADVLPTLRSLPQQTIHNDANNDNIVVSTDGTVSLIDYGDIVRGPRVVGLGVAVAYAMLEQDDPLAAAAELVAGYHDVAPLDPNELAVLDSIVRTRLAMSITIAEMQVREQPDNVDYLTTSQASITALVRLLRRIPPTLARAAYRDACGYLPVPEQRSIDAFFGSSRFDPAPIVDDDLRNATVLDWSHGVERVHRMTDHGPSLGKYGELRTIYDTEAFATPFGERRTLHLGIDVFVPAGRAVYSPLAGTVHACGVRPEPGDYGGVAMIEYRTSDDVPFWMLVGHLSPTSIAALSPGRHLDRGAEFARVGTPRENGGWTPHLHVQMFTDLLGGSTDLDGVARASQRDLWTSISPNPAPLVVGVDRRTITAEHPRTTSSIARRRRVNLSPSLSLSYDEPLHIVRGEGAELIDVDGRRWLDLVNNVAHVGHEHPRVVDAIGAQARRLNTNTRYLHTNIVDYAERLRALFPDPLSVVFLTNSGSEAVDLALRLARTTTGREGVLTLDWAYHGNLSSLVEISPYKFNRSGGRGQTARVRICELPDPFRGAHGDDGPRYADDVRHQARSLADAGFPAAAFVHESISGCGGQVDLATGYLGAAYDHARAAGALCIADEVQCGLGRVGRHWWAFEQQGVIPDIVTMGKPLGNGHPLGAVITTPRIARAFANGMEYFNTFGGNPVSCAAGLAVLDVIDDERLRAHAEVAGDRLSARLRDLAGRQQTIGDVRGRGLFVGVDLVENRSTQAPATNLARQTVEELRRLGILISSDGPNDNVLKLKPPLVITTEQIERTVDALDHALTTIGDRPA